MNLAAVNADESSAEEVDSIPWTDWAVITGSGGALSHLQWPQQTLSSAGVPKGCSEGLPWQSAAFTKHPFWQDLNILPESLGEGTVQQLLQWLYHYHGAVVNKEHRTIFIVQRPSHGQAEVSWAFREFNHSISGKERGVDGERKFLIGNHKAFKMQKVNRRTNQSCGVCLVGFMKSHSGGCTREYWTSGVCCVETEVSFLC